MLGGWVSYWMIPLFSAVVWLVMLLAMLIYWLTTGKPIYDSMVRRAGDTENIPYISDVGADTLKPLFIAMGAISVITFDLVFLFERWLRHKGRLVENTSRGQKILSAGSIFFAIIGAAGLILLTIFDTRRHSSLHNLFLALFIGGYVVSAVFICAEYQRLGIKFRQFRVLRISFWMKLFFILIEVVLAIAFGALGRLHHYNSAAVVEWVIALIYAVFVSSFIIDFLPAARKRHYDNEQPMTMDEVANGSRPANVNYEYPPDRSLGQALRDTGSDQHSQHTHHKHGNGNTHF